MFLDPANFRHPAFRTGMADAFKVAPGIWAWGLMTGVSMVQAGLGPAMSTWMTLLVYGGSAQLAVTPLMAVGTPVWVLLATAFCVNLRFAVFSLHLRGYMMAWPRWQRLTIGYLIADLNYVQFVQNHPQPATDAAGQRAEMAYLCGNCFLTWTELFLVQLRMAHFAFREELLPVGSCTTRAAVTSHSPAHLACAALPAFSTLPLALPALLTAPCLPEPAFVSPLRCVLCVLCSHS